MASIAFSTPRRRLWFPLTTLGLALVGIAWCAMSPFVDDGLRFPFVCVTLVAAGLAMNVWFLLLGQFSWQTRAIGLLAQFLCVVAWNAVLRVDGWTGDMTPVLAWRWSLHPEAKAAAQSLPASDPGERVKLDAGPDDFPRFLGPDGNGVVTGRNLEPDWKTHPPREIWRKPVGLGWSAFAIAGAHAITQEQIADQELVTCRRLDTGEIVWSHRDHGRFSEWMGGDGPRATPTIHEGDVYVMNAQGLLHRLDGATGRPKWTRDILQDHAAQNLQWAKSCSPLIVGDRVIVTLGESPAAPSLAAYDRESGTPIWSAGVDKAAYGTPVLATIAGRPQILVANAKTIAGHDLQTGTLLWKAPYAGDMAKCSNAVPLPGDRVFASAGYGAGGILLQVVDQNGAWSATPVWTRPRLMRTRFTNVVVMGRYLFGLDDSVLQCIEVDAGQQTWRAGRYGQGQVLRVDDLLIVQAEQGDVVLVAADPQRHRELGRIPALTSKTWNNPALAGNRLLVRNAEEAACYELPRRHP